MLVVENKIFQTTPSIIHAHGSHDFKPNWKPILESFQSSSSEELGCPSDLTVITCNNGNPMMGLFESSLRKLGIPFKVFGEGIDPWVNSIHKPQVIVEALELIESQYVLYADSRDAIMIGDPSLILESYLNEFDARLLFGADRLNWPPIKAFEKFEDRCAKGFKGDFNYLNGGTWIGEREFCLSFFKASQKVKGVDKVPDSEQGILKKLFMDYYPDVQLDYECKLFQNIGFVTSPIFNIKEESIAI